MTAAQSFEIAFPATAGSAAGCWFSEVISPGGTWSVDSRGKRERRILSGNYHVEVAPIQARTVRQGGGEEAVMSLMVSVEI